MDYRRRLVPGGTFFFTVVAYHCHPLFREPGAYELFKSVVAEVKAERAFDIDAAVVLYDHLHMIWSLPGGDTDYSGRWGKIKSQFTRRWLSDSTHVERGVSPAKRKEGRRGVWQPKFYEHTIRDDDDMIRHVEYIHYNPVKHGLVACPKDWPWSSFHRYVRDGVYPIDWCCGSEPPIGRFTEMDLE